MTHFDTTLYVIFLILLLFLQAGFLVFEAGTIREKNAFNTAMKNLSDLILGTVFYFLALLLSRAIGAAFSQDSSSLPSPGLVPKDLIAACFAVTCITISSGAVAERIRFTAYLLLCAFSAGITYPVIEWVCWGQGGWLHGLGFTDRAGSGVVHGTGGAIALAAAQHIGPRLGRFDPSRQGPFPLGNVVLVCLGCLIMLIGWFGFNLSSLPPGGRSIPEACLIIMLGSLGGGICGLLQSYDRKGGGVFRVRPIINGMLGGLVAITASFDGLTQLEAVFVGLIGGFVASSLDGLLARAHVDDPVSAIGVHLGAGLFGVFAASLVPGAHTTVQILGAGFILATGYGLTKLFLIVFEKLIGPLRPSPEHERAGLNFAEHGAPSLADELYSSVARQVTELDWSARARVEPYTSIGAIAARYNEVMTKLQEEFQSRLEVIDQGAKGQLQMAALAHDLRNPIHALKGEAFVVSSKLQQGQAVAPDRVAKTVRVIEEQCKQIDALIDSVLSHSKTRYLGSSSIEASSWPSIFSRLKNLFAQRLGDNSITLVLPDRAPRRAVALPEVQMVRVLANLVSNSLRALSRQNAESIGGARGQISIRISEEEGRSLCRVEDNGPGIAPSVVPKLFEPFLTSQQDGHGVGLAASRMILHDFGGDIWMESSKPACFIVAVPQVKSLDNLTEQSEARGDR